ncbi:2Fe-2S iron-sulfur cluster-binding protein [Streptomyces sp. HNA39]|uniref:2Fe-2S iron-sulfur cluster-binding protein n=1 Tax=Streptomyces sp. HNA39 TaxID=2850561 RepID=UPI00200F859C|nr:2Fe-2S iron-sulfur cluster-binding protein [Streptomyces sp. HNA39]UQA34248.1 2Fe-2S iron-sulfur cluster binding domain-containing protein [Streptomyces sp. HNA39]
MSNEEHPDPRYGGWEPTPQSGEYDADATAFVQLTPEDLDGVPLAAPGHGYVPPMILPLTPAAGPDPAATGGWVVQAQDRQEAGAEGHAQEAAPGAVHWPDPNGQGGGYAQPYQDGPHSTAQWNFTEALGEQPAAAGAADRVGQGHAEHAGPGDYPGAGGHVSPGDHAGAGGHAGPDDYTDHPGPAGHTGHPGQTDGAGHADQANYAGHAGQADHTGQISHTDYSAHQEHAGHTAPTEPTAPSSPTGHTGQWTIPVADGDLPDESGEFLASAAASQQWYADDARPATLPGGAPAPWATQPQPESHPEEQAAPHPLPGTAPEADVEADAEPAPGPAPEAAAKPEAEPEAEVPAADEPATEPTPPVASSATPESAPESAPEPGTTPEPAAADGQTEDAAPAPEDPAAASSTQHPAPEAEPEPDPSHDIAHDPVAAPLDVPSEHPAASYVLHVNGVDRPVSDAWIGESLLYVLRERLGLAGAKDGCSQGECGACSVQVDGRLVASCLVPAATAAGSEVRTVEGLAVDGEPSDVQRALAACGAVQCGFCIPGMAMTVHDLLEGNHAPSELETRQALCGNLCRCSGYRGVLDAVADLVASREATAEAAATAQTATAQDEPRVPHQAEPGAGGVQQQPHPHEGGAQ